MSINIGYVIGYVIVVYKTGTLFTSYFFSTFKIPSNIFDVISN